MADNETYTPAAPRVNSADKPDPTLQRAAEIEREHEQQRAERAAKKQVKQQREAQKAARPKIDLLRPVELVGAFIGGTVMGTFTGLGNGARYGFWVGGAAGILACVAAGFSGGLFPAAMLFGSCVIAGFGIGGAAGVLVGGINGVRQEVKREAQEDAVASKSHPAAKSAPQQPKLPTADELHEEQKLRTRVNYDRTRQQEIENKQDYQTYWQDRVAAESNGWGMGRNG